MFPGLPFYANEARNAFLSNPIGIAMRQLEADEKPKKESESGDRRKGAHDRSRFPCVRSTTGEGGIDPDENSGCAFNRFTRVSNDGDRLFSSTSGCESGMRPVRKTKRRKSLGV